jgi:hypothetical protein
VHEEEVVLEAIAATPAKDDLVLQSGKVEPDRAAKKRIDVLERDRLGMQEMQRLQRIQRCERNRRRGRRERRSSGRGTGHCPGGYRHSIRAPQTWRAG